MSSEESLVEMIFKGTKNAIATTFATQLKSLAAKIAEDNEIDESGVLKSMQKYTGVAPENSKGRKEKISYSFKKNELIIIEDYTPRSSAIFGNTKDAKNHIKEYGTKHKGTTRYNENLAYGPGWTFNGDIAEMKKFLQKMLAKWTIRVVSHEDWKKELGISKKTSKSKETDSESQASEEEEVPEDPEEEEEEKPKKSSKDKKKEDKKKNGKESKKENSTKKEPLKNGNSAANLKTVAPKVTDNDWGNSEESDSGIIFKELPVGVNGRKMLVAIGQQDTEKEYEVTGIDSLIALSDDQIKECKKKKWTYLTDEHMATLKKKASADYNKLKKMKERADEGNEEEAEEEGEVEEDE